MCAGRSERIRARLSDHSHCPHPINAAEVCCNIDVAPQGGTGGRSPTEGRDSEASVQGPPPAV